LCRTSVPSLDPREVPRDSCEIAFCFDLFSWRCALGSAYGHVGSQLLNQESSSFDGLDDEQRAFSVFVPDVDVNAEVSDEGTEEVKMVVASSGVDKRVTVLVLLRGEGGFVAEEGE
jgi:hypothetical protein